MATVILNAKELFTPIEDAANEFIELLASLEDRQINMIPFKDSWTAAQVTEHVTRSIAGIAKALNIEGKPTARNPGKREKELKDMFLDFTIKFQSPEFILPTKDMCNKEALITDLKNSIAHLKEESEKINLTEAINHRAFGEITKLELLHFVKFHSQRHLHQLNRIVKTVRSK